MAGKLTNAEVQVWVDEYLKQGSIRRTNDVLGIKHYNSGWKRYKAALERGLLEPPPWAVKGRGQPTREEIKEFTAPAIAGRIEPIPHAVVDRRLGVHRFILTCAQNNTHLHEQCWDNLVALARHYDADLMVARTVYNRFSDMASMDKKLVISGDLDRIRPNKSYWWDQRLEPYFSDVRVKLAPDIVWCGEMNVIPTMSNPLAGLETYTGAASTVVPHPRVAMRSMPTLGINSTKFMYTTGTVTQRNYIQRRMGQLAEFHHCYGGLLVEVDPQGHWWARQLIADDEGTIHDLNLRAFQGKVSSGNSVEAITWGDIHVAYGDPAAYGLAWGWAGQGGPASIIDTLEPRYQFLHDLLDFRARSAHSMKQPARAFIEWAQGHIRVEEELEHVMAFLANAVREDCETVIVNSNHHNFLDQWLEHTGDFRKDPHNAVFFLKCALHYWGHMQEHHKAPNMLEWVIRNTFDAHHPVADVRCLSEDESFLICGDIECGLHGHERFNGARGGPRAFSKLGTKMNAGHVHSAGIWDGAYFAGIMGSLDQGYNKGLGGWSQSNIITYPTGKRTIQTIHDGRPWADY